MILEFSAHENLENMTYKKGQIYNISTKDQMTRRIQTGDDNRTKLVNSIISSRANT